MLFHFAQSFDKSLRRTLSLWYSDKPDILDILGRFSDAELESVIVNRLLLYGLCLAHRLRLVHFLALLQLLCLNQWDKFVPA